MGNKYESLVVAPLWLEILDDLEPNYDQVDSRVKQFRCCGVRDQATAWR